MTLRRPDLLAHSAPRPGAEPDFYEGHVRRVRSGAQQRAETMLRFGRNPPPDFSANIDIAAAFHDIGKLDLANQSVLREGRAGRMPWDHIDAGVTHLLATGNRMAAWLVKAHHAPGLPCLAKHFDPDDLGLKLCGRRGDSVERIEHLRQIERADEKVSQYLADHAAAVGPLAVSPARASHGLTLRLALSCPVDADYSDTAAFDTGVSPGEPASPRWQDRLHRLDAYDFILDLVDGITRHPDARDPGEVLKRQFARGDFGSMSPADLVSTAMVEELKAGMTQDRLSKAEKERDYPETARHGRVIQANTRIVVVDIDLADRLRAGERSSFQEILSYSVQMWAQRIETLGLRAVPGRRELYEWPHEYDGFLGYMAGVLKMRAYFDAGGEVI